MFGDLYGLLCGIDHSTTFNALPSTEGGYVLLTTRSQMTGPFARSFDLEQMRSEEGALFPLRRARFLGPQASLEQTCQADQDATKAISRLLDGLPLALDQAGAYIEETACSLCGYIERYCDWIASPSGGELCRIGWQSKAPVQTVLL